MLPEHIEEMLRTKDFESLTETESEQVLVHLSGKEYADFRKLMLEGKQALASKLIIPDRKDFLLRQFEKQHKQPLFTRITNYAIPLYQVAAIFVILFGLFAVLGRDVISGSENNKVYVYLTDTIYKEVLVPDKIWLADSSIRNSFYDYDQANSFVGEPQLVDMTIPHKNSDESNLSSDEKYTIAKRSGIIPEVDLNAVQVRNRGGKSLKEDSVWRKYMVVSF